VHGEAVVCESRLSGANSILAIVSLIDFYGPLVGYCLECVFGECVAAGPRRVWQLR
jgi:hypothetical protein